MANATENFKFLRDLPLVVATVASQGGLETITANCAEGSFDLVEFRLDSLLSHLDDAERLARRLASPMLATVRRADEGGSADLTAAERLGIYRRFLPHSAVIDVEFRSLGELPGLIDEAHGVGVKVVASFHDFRSMPPVERLREIIEGAAEAGADCAKLAVTPGGAPDVLALAALVAEAHQIPVSAMGMGRWGKASRLLLAQCGSVLNYGYLDAPNAPGQWPAAQFKELVSEWRHS